MARTDDNTMSPAAAGAAAASPLELGFVGLASMIAWAVHFWAVFSLVVIACRTDFPSFSFAGLSGLQVLLTVVTVALGLVALAAGVVSYRINQRADVGLASDRDGPRELAAFMGQTGLLMSGFFLLAIVIAAVPAFALAPCE